MKIKRRIKYYLIRLFRLKASPHQVALGLTLGFIPNWFPTFGLGPMASIGLAKLTRVNILAAAVGGLIGTPLWPIFFLLNYKIGSLLLMKPNIVDEIDEVEYIEAVNDTVGSLQSGGLSFLTGALVNVLVTSLFIYFLVFFIYRKYRLRLLVKLRY